METGGMDTERDTVEGLGDRVVQFAGQPLALFNGSQFLRLFVEPCVFYRDRLTVAPSNLTMRPSEAASTPVTFVLRKILR